MKKCLIMVLLVFSMLSLVACNGDGYTEIVAEDTQNYTATQTEIPAVSESTTLVQTDVDAVMENLSGQWDLSDAGILITVQADGTWDTSWGDIEFRGKVELTQGDGVYTVEFVILEKSGPGAMYDSYGNIREEAFNMETGEYYWIPFSDDARSLWLFGTYYVDSDRLVIESIWGEDLGQDMKRIDL